MGQTPHQYLLLKDIPKLKQRTLPSPQLKVFRLGRNRSKIFLPLLVADGGKYLFNASRVARVAFWGEM